VKGNKWKREIKAEKKSDNVGFQVFHRGHYKEYYHLRCVESPPTFRRIGTALIFRVEG
jgi:hypothetical protein